MKIISKYFPNLTQEQVDALERFKNLFADKNQIVNMISRKDVENLEERHILHSLAIGKFIHFKPQTKIMDIGTGGGFPGIPLAIMFPQCKFYLVDSIGKKIKMVEEMCQALRLENVEAINARAESVDLRVDFIVSRAVAPLSDLYRWGNKSLYRDKYNDKSNGFILLKGGNLTEEKNDLKIHLKRGTKITEVPLSQYFREEFFETKKIIYYPF